MENFTRFKGFALALSLVAATAGASAMSGQESLNMQEIQNAHKGFNCVATQGRLPGTIDMKAAAADQETLLEETFDDNAGFADGATMPGGWVSTGTYPFSRQRGSDFGLNAHSGSYVFGTPSSSASMNRDEFFCTKKIMMKAGKEYTLSFWYKAPGGNTASNTTQIVTKVGAQQAYAGMLKTLGETPAERTSEWTQASYRFTPDVDGEYCFGFNLLTVLYNSGAVVIDDILVTGPKESGEIDPEDKVVCELPYSQSFDNENNDYDGQHYVPNGWMATGTAPFRTANFDELKAKDGTWYAVAPESSVSRDDRLYTAYFKLEAGVTYKAKFWLYMPGNNGVASNLDFTVGTEQDSEFHSSILSLPGYTNTGWTEQNATFTPTETDYYCFSFALSGENARAGEVCIDLFTLLAEGQKSKPQAAFSFNGNFNLMDSSLMGFGTAKAKMANQTTNGDSFQWKVTGPTTTQSNEENPEFTFSESGRYTISLTAKNDFGESTSSEDVDVTVVTDKTSQFPLTAYNPNEDEPWSRDDMLSFDTAPGIDWVTGINHYYTSFAEKFDLNPGFDFSISSISYYLCYYNLASRYYTAQAMLPLKVVVYGDKDGRPDPDTVYGRYQTTMMDAFGTLGLSTAEMRAIQPASPIVAKSPFYIAFEFSKDVWIDEPDETISRTSVGIGGFNHRSGESTLFARPTAVPATSSYVPDGNYCPIDDLDMQYKGVGLNLVVWTTAGRNGETGLVALSSDGNVAFAARLDGNTLTVSGTQEGEPLTVCNAAGQVIAKATATARTTTLSLDAQPGIYMVTTKAGTRKFIKR